MTSSTDSMNFDINNQQGVPDVEREESPTYSQMTEETSDVRARGQGSQQQPQEEVTLRALMDFMRKQKEEINENFIEIRREQNEKFEKLEEKFEKQKEEINEKFEEQNENFTQIRAEMREYINNCDKKIDEVQKQQNEVIKELKEDTDKKFEEVRETRELDRQELKSIAQNTQTSIKKIHNRVETHVKENHKKQEELKVKLFQTVRQLQQEQGDVNNTTFTWTAEGRTKVFMDKGSGLVFPESQEFIYRHSNSTVPTAEPKILYSMWR